MRIYTNTQARTYTNIYKLDKYMYVCIFFFFLLAMGFLVTIDHCPHTVPMPGYMSISHAALHLGKIRVLNGLGTREYNYPVIRLRQYNMYVRFVFFLIQKELTMQKLKIRNHIT